MLHRVEGIVIRSMDYGESNKIISLYTRELGKVSVMVRGAKKMKSRYSAIAQLFTYGEFTFFKAGQMGTLNHGEIIDAHHRLREELHLTAYSSYMVELVDRMSEDQAPYAGLFEQLKAALTAMEEGKDPQIIVHMMEMIILQASGYSPVLSECVSCSDKTANAGMSVGLGGMVCKKCAHKDPMKMVISETVLKLLRLFQTVDLRRLGKIEVKDETKAQLKQLMRKYMDEHIGIQLKSRSFLDQMEKYKL